MVFAVAQSAKDTASTSSVTPAFASATTTGNLIVLCFAADDYNGTVDSGWTESSEMEQQTYHGGYLWWKLSTGETTVSSYTIGSATTSAWVLTEFSDTDTSAPYDTSQGQFQQTSTGSYTSAAITPSTGQRLLVAAFGGSSGGTTDISGAYSAWTDSFTAVDNVGWATGSARVCMGVGWREVTGDGSTTFSTGVAYPGTVQSKTSMLASFKAATGGGAASDPFPPLWSYRAATIRR